MDNELLLIGLLTIINASMTVVNLYATIKIDKKITNHPTTEGKEER